MEQTNDIGLEQPLAVESRREHSKLKVSMTAGGSELQKAERYYMFRGSNNLHSPIWVRCDPTWRKIVRWLSLCLLAMFSTPTLQQIPLSRGRWSQPCCQSLPLLCSLFSSVSFGGSRTALESLAACLRSLSSSNQCNQKLEKDSTLKME